jgi:hypothetical protein
MSRSSDQVPNLRSCAGTSRWQLHLARFIGAFVLLTGYLPCCQLQPNQLAVFRIFAAQKLGFLPAYRLVNIQKTMENPHFSWENPHFSWENPLQMASFMWPRGAGAWQGAAGQTSPGARQRPGTFGSWPREAGMNGWVENPQCK